MTKLQTQFSVYLNGKAPHDKVLRAFAKGCGGQTYEQGKSFAGGITVIAGLETESLSRIKHCQKEGKPYIFIDHAYFDRGYQYGNMRVCLNGVYQSTLLNVPGDRVRASLKPWRQGREVLVIVPSERVCEALGYSRRWAQETAEELKKYTNRPIRLKTKGDPWPEDVHCLVSLASVAEVERAVAGIPCFTSEHSPAAQISEKDFSKIETPIYPNRDMWLRTLSYSQWNVGEMAVGQTTRHLERVLNGDLNLCRAALGGGELA